MDLISAYYREAMAAEWRFTHKSIWDSYNKLTNSDLYRRHDRGMYRPIKAKVKRLVSAYWPLIKKADLYLVNCHVASAPEFCVESAEEVTKAFKTLLKLEERYVLLAKEYDKYTMLGLLQG